MSEVEPALTVRGGAAVVAILSLCALGSQRPVALPLRYTAPDAAPTARGAAWPPARGRVTRRRFCLEGATQAELESLPGIGPALAGRILADRARQGPFETLAALQRVRGIGAAKLRAIEAAGLASTESDTDPCRGGDEERVERTAPAGRNPVGAHVGTDQPPTIDEEVEAE